MTRFRKKPVEVDAWQFTQPVDEAVPSWVVTAIGAGMARFWPSLGEVMTNHGPVTVNLGDWIIRSPEGELYPATDAVMKATYEPVDGQPGPVAQAAKVVLDHIATLGASWRSTAFDMRHLIEHPDATSPPAATRAPRE